MSARPLSLTALALEHMGQQLESLDASHAALARSTAAVMVDASEKARTNQATPISRRMATVTEVNPGPPLTVDVLFSGELVPGASPVANYWPSVGDTVWLYFAGTDSHVFPPLHQVGLQDHINRAQSPNSAQVVELGAGTYDAANLVVSNTGELTIRGAGSGKTILMLPDGSDSPILSTEDFDTLVGSNSIGGVRKLKIIGVTFDGNKANQTTPADLVRIYGCDLWLEDVVIRYGSGKGLVTEWSNDSASPGGDSMESNIFGLRVHDCDGDNISWNGPHDSQFVNVISYLSGGICCDFGPNAFACLVVNGHGWGLGHTLSWRLQASGIQLIQCTGEGASIGAVQILANDCSVHGFYFDATGGGKGILLGSAVVDVSGCVIDVHLLNFASGALDWTGDPGGNRVRATIFQTTGVEEIGTNNRDTMVEIMMTGRVGQISRTWMKGRAQADGMDVLGNLTAAGDDFQFDIENNTVGASERTRIRFIKNGAEKWIIFTDSGDNGTHDWFLYDAVPGGKATVMRVVASGVVGFPYGWGTGNYATSAGGGTVTHSYPVYDDGGTLLGYGYLHDTP